MISKLCLTSGFRRKVDKNCALLGSYASPSGNSLPSFHEEIIFPVFRGLDSQPLKLGCPETSVINYHYSLLNDPGERSFDIDITADSISISRLITSYFVPAAGNTKYLFIWGGAVKFRTMSAFQIGPGSSVV